MRSRHTARMSQASSGIGLLAETLRAARKGRRLSIAQLAVIAGVSPRLISEVERGRRAHVSFDTAMRLLDLVGASVTFESRAARSEDTARTRAERRRQLWTGEQSTLSAQEPPPPSPDAAARLTAVVRVSRLAAGLQAAYDGTKRTRVSKTKTTT